MHEMSVIAEMFWLLRWKIKKYKLKKITKIVVQIGEMTCINEEALKFAFDIFSEETIANGAEFVVKKVPALAKCSNCGKIFSINYFKKRCPVCNEYSDIFVSGNEIILEKVEGETNEDDNDKRENTG